MDAADSPLDDLLSAPDRDHAPGAREVVPLREGDDPGLRAAIDARAEARVELERRGRWHGEWAVLRTEAPATDAVPFEARLHQRWHAARPIVLRGALELFGLRAELQERMRLVDELAERGGLNAFLRRRTSVLAPEFRIEGPEPLADPERDLERIRLTWCPDPADPRAPRVRDLWVKSSWLSIHDSDRSLRLRLSFGREGPDDAARDGKKHRRVAQLAERLLPECTLVHEHAALGERLERWVGDEVAFSQHIAYWNAPEGGALFHHDAFEESLVGGQRGVVFAQLVGRSAWLALSLADLAARVAEFLELLAEGEAPWVRDALFPRAGDLERALEVAEHPARLARELARAGCGRFGGVVEQGAEFTAFLADAGHAHVLDPGDVIVLPNQGLGNTCMHSVFCGGDETAYGLSLAVRERNPSPEEPPDEAPAAARPRRRRAHPR